MTLPMFEKLVLELVWGWLERMAVAVHVFMPVLVDVYIMWLVANQTVVCIINSSG